MDITDDLRKLREKLLNQVATATDTVKGLQAAVDKAQADLAVGQAAVQKANEDLAQFDKGYGLYTPMKVAAPTAKAAPAQAAKKTASAKQDKTTPAKPTAKVVPQEGLSKKGFVLSLPMDTPIKDVIAKALTKGIDLTPNYISNIRSAERKVASTPVKKAAPKAKVAAKAAPKAKVAAKAAPKAKVTAKAAPKAKVTAKAKAAPAKAKAVPGQTRAAKGRRAVASKERPILKEAIKQVMGNKTMSAKDVHDALDEKGWLPDAGDPRTYIGHVLSTLSDASDVDHVFVRVPEMGRGYYRVDGVTNGSKKAAKTAQASTSGSKKTSGSRKGSSKSNGSASTDELLAEAGIISKSSGASASAS